MYCVSTVAGDGTEGYQDGSALTAKFHWPQGITLDSQNNLLVADYHNDAIRRISSDRTTVSTLAGGRSRNTDERGTNPLLPRDITTLQSGDFLVSDSFCIRRITAEGEVS